MKIFLDTSVLLSCCGSGKGASRFILEQSEAKGWKLQSSRYCREETLRNLGKLHKDATGFFHANVEESVIWNVDTVVSSKVVVFPKAKDKPVLLSALATKCDVLLTLDREDFHERIGSQFYGMGIYTPGDWLLELREKGLL